MNVETKFTLGSKITDEQRAFLARYGFLHFKRVAREDEVQVIRAEQARLAAEWLAEGKKKVNGIPIFFGRDSSGQRMIQRLPFSSRFSPPISRFVRDPRFRPLATLVGEDARVGELEKDGVVLNRYINLPGSVYGKLGWHTDGLRDLFYFRMPQQMLNFGLHLDHCPKENGGLRLIPGTHEQGFLSMCFRKAYFVSHAPDPEEIAVETEPGDLTVHDGRLWHRVAQSARTGEASLRRTMFVPILSGPYEPKTEASKTPAYHTLGQLLREMRVRI